MPQTLILAKSITEANSYAKVAGLPRFSYRAVRNAGAIRGVRHAEVHILSSFASRLDRHRILGELRWAKTLEVFYVDFRDGQILDGENEPAPADPRGELTGRQLEAAYRYNTLRDSDAGPEPVRFAGAVSHPVAMSEEAAAEADERTALLDALRTGEDSSSDEPVTDEPIVNKKRRRSRCRECGALHFSDEPCPQPILDPDPVAGFRF